MSEAGQRVLVDREPQPNGGTVVHVRLNRPDKRNGLDLAMFEALLEEGLAIKDDRAVRAVVLSGEGKAFCAGLDWASFMAAPDVAQRLLERDDRSPANLAQRIAWIWQEVPVPVICAIQGQAFGGGLQLALGADLRFARPDAELSVMEIRWGLIPDMGASQTLLAVVPRDVAKELVFTGRVVSGEEAVRIGLATRTTDDPIGEALEVARRIAEQSPDAIRRGKRLMNEAPGGTPRQTFALETALQVQLLGRPNQAEAVRANFEKRAPVFSDPEG